MRIIRNAIALCVVAVGLLVIATSLASAKWPMDKP